MNPSGPPLRLAVAVPLLCALLALSPALYAAPQVRSGGCSCASLPPAAVPRLGIRGPPIYHNYDEQLGVTFTQSLTSIEYNVTAMPQTDPGLGTGPAYLVNGLSDMGYWYQVGVSWDWAPGDNPGTGLAMSYEVFDPQGNSVFPADGQGGLQAFSGPVNPGDVVLLDLYFSGPSGDVVMRAYDTSTGASASATYPSMGASYFVGLQGSVANREGFFTGLMTEWYHGLPYFADEAPAVYSDSGGGLTSAWMWMDEFNASDYAPVFAYNTTSPVSLGTGALRALSYNGTTEYAGASELVTGALADPAADASGTPLVLSYAVRGARGGSSPPVLSYVSGGEPASARLTGEPTLYFPGRGTAWSVSPALGGSNATWRWAAGQATAGVASSPASEALTYYAQALVDFRFAVTGGGSGYSPPAVQYSSFGKAASSPAGEEVWADSGAGYRYQNPLAGSTGAERWFTAAAGAVAGPGPIDAVYYLQYLVTFDVSFGDAGIIPALAVESSAAGSPYSAGVVPGANGVWLDAGAAYFFPPSFSLGAGERYLLNGTASGEVAGPSTVDVAYEAQFYMGVQAGSPAGGTVSPPAGWYDSGSVLRLDAVPSPGWQFEGWQGSGSDSVSGAQPQLVVPVGPGAPSNETAVFYAGVTISARGPSSASYRDGLISGSVPAGGEEVVYVPPGTTLGLAGSSAPPWIVFYGWSGAAGGRAPEAAVTVDGPLSVTAASGYDVPALAATLLLAAAALGGGAAWMRRAKRGRGLGPHPKNSTQFPSGSLT